jgi:TPR repeat protein
MGPGVSLVAKLGVAALMIAACLPLPAHAEKRVALVIGNSAYRNVTTLENPKNDAKLMAETLRSLGFILVDGAAQLDLDKPGIDRAVQKFGDLLQGADVGLFYYAGHGVQVRGGNYLVPVDANPTRESDVDFQMLDTNLVLRQMADAGTKLNVVILDACRNNPFGGRGLRATGGGLAQMQAPEGTLVSFATQPGNVARDGADGNSPYTEALARTISRPGVGIFEAFNEVGLSVMQATGNAQQPWLSTSPIRGSFYFGGPPAAASAAVSTDPAATTKEARLTNPTDTLRLDLLTDCDRLAAHPADTQRPPGIPGVPFAASIDVVPALRACDAVMRQYPDVARFVFQAGRVAHVQKDYAVAKRRYEQAIAMGSNLAMSNLAYLYQGGEGVPQDYTQVRVWFEKAAAAGEPQGISALGWFYRNGWGVPQDYDHARRMFEKAVASGNTNTMNGLGGLYAAGFGVTKDLVQARQWYEKAAAAGDRGAMNTVGLYNQNAWGVPQDYAEARKWFSKAADLGDTNGMVNLGGLYQNGWGVTKDYTVARQWNEKAAAGGHVGALNALGTFYANGWGVTKDYNAARQWYEKGAAAGNAVAMYNLVLAYVNGWGVAKDYNEARDWYEKAAAKGEAEAMNNLGVLYGNGWGVTKDYTQARQWYEKSAAAGNPMPTANLAGYYANGLGGPKDAVQARSLWEKAAAACNDQAKEALKKLNGKK